MRPSGGPLKALLLALLACPIYWELRIYAIGFDQYGVGIALMQDRAAVEARRDEVLSQGWRIPRLPGEHPDDVKWLLPGAIYRWDITKWCCPGFPEPCVRPDSLGEK